ncbi:MAG: hypothetical protein QNJ97_10815 [Myxococcota bacterium]|nr:hypothetical protein [Myxococcota bacterium]
MKTKDRKNTHIGGDLLCLAPGWLILFFVDPMIAVFFGIPIGMSLILARRMWWGDRLISGRIVVGLSMLPLALIPAAAIVGEGIAPLSGMLCSGAVLGLVEWQHRRRNRLFIPRFPLLSGLFFFALCTLFSLLSFEWGVLRAPTLDFTKALTAAPPPPTWSDQAKAQAVEVVRRVIAHRDAAQHDPLLFTQTLAPEVPDLAKAPLPSGVYVTLYDRKTGWRRRGSAGSKAATPFEVVSATLDAFARPPIGKGVKRVSPQKQPALSEATAVQIDIAGPCKSAATRPIFGLLGKHLRRAHPSLKKLGPIGFLFNLAFDAEIGVDGFQIQHNAQQAGAVILPSDPVTAGWLTPRVRSGPAKIQKMFGRAQHEAFGKPIDDLQGARIGKFRTTSFGQYAPNEPIIDWFRGNALLNHDLTHELLVNRTILAADWLSRRVQPTGRFHYEMFPPYKSKTRSYNLPRHAGSVYGLFAVARAATREPAFAEAGQQALRAGLTALAFIQQHLGSPNPTDAPHISCFLGKAGRATSGATALATLSVSELPDPSSIVDPQLRQRASAVPRNPLLVQMGDCLLEMIDAKGAVYRDYAEAQASEEVAEEPLYFPGEVMLALVRAYKRVKKQRFLEGAARIGNRQLKTYQVALWFGFPFPGDHWMIQGLGELAEVTAHRDYAELSVLLASGYLREQHPRLAYLFPDYLGAYHRVADLPRTTRAASRGEALGAALGANRFLGRDGTKIETALIKGARHLIEQQFIKENSYFVPNKMDVLGGIRMGLVDNHLRIDNNQHAIVALLNALAVMADASPMTDPRIEASAR